MNKKIINEYYLKDETVEEMNSFFQQEGFIQLTGFLNEKKAKWVRDIILKQKFQEDFKPMFHKREKLNNKELFEPEIIEILEFFRSKDFTEYIENITGFELSAKETSILKFKHTDYTILNDNINNEEIIEVIYDLSDNFSEKMGGKVTYLTKEDEILYLSPVFNSLTIIYKPKEVMKYLKYINNRANNRKIIRIETKMDFIEEITNSIN